ncbi:MAG TPA: hypothetical protein VK923_11465 [Euzebyales bacterium]|nr:hypothetical protein [Euzebyales bacterium]
MDIQHDEPTVDELEDENQRLRDELELAETQLKAIRAIVARDIR